MKWLLSCTLVAIVAAATFQWAGAKVHGDRTVKILDMQPAEQGRVIKAHRPAHSAGMAGAAAVGLDLCGVCIQVSVIMVNELLNIIANEGILSGCTTLCGKLPQKLEQEVCDAGCIGVGLDEFIHILERVDIDPIFYCELVRLCPIVDCQGRCLSIRSMNVTPAEVSLGKPIKATVELQVYNKTGTGMTRVDIYNRAQPKMLPLQHDYLTVGQDAGLYSVAIDIDTEEETDFWHYTPGPYTVQVWFCEGECGSQHPHSKIYDVHNGTFVITN
eukprot:scpid35037/ scgid20919/ Countin-1